jgi:hypothetical protein
MPRIRIATFNVENLFIRPPADRPRGRGDRRFGMFVFDDDAEALSVRRMVEAALSDDERQLTAQALLDCEASSACRRSRTSRRWSSSATSTCTARCARASPAI